MADFFSIAGPFVFVSTVFFALGYSLLHAYVEWADVRDMLDSLPREADIEEERGEKGP